MLDVGSNLVGVSQLLKSVTTLSEIAIATAFGDFHEAFQQRFEGAPETEQDMLRKIHAQS